MRIYITQLRPLSVIFQQGSAAAIENICMIYALLSFRLERRIFFFGFVQDSAAAAAATGQCFEYKMTIGINQQ